MQTGVRDVQVVDLREFEDQIELGEVPSIDLGGGYDVAELLGESQLSQIVGAWSYTRTRMFLLFWRGQRVPEGVEVGGEVIGRINEYNHIDDANYHLIGTFNWLVDGGGAEGDEYAILVFLDRK